MIQTPKSKFVCFLSISHKWGSIAVCVFPSISHSQMRICIKLDKLIGVVEDIAPYSQPPFPKYFVNPSNPPPHELTR